MPCITSFLMSPPMSISNFDEITEMGITILRGSG